MISIKYTILITSMTLLSLHIALTVLFLILKLDMGAKFSQDKESVPLILQLSCYFHPYARPKLSKA